MKFSVERASLSDAVTRLQKVVGAKTSMPVLEGILISAESGKITLAAYNLEMGMKKEIYAHCEEEGDIVINARLLSDILRRMAGTAVEIEADSKLMCHIKSEGAVFDIMGMAAADFPEMPSVSEGIKLSLEGDVFTEMVRGTIFAVAAAEGTRPILTGIDISVKDGKLQFVGIDGFRLAIRRQKTQAKENCEFVIAGRAVNEVSKLIGEETENIEIIIGKRLVSFNIEGYVFISRLLDGEFVNYEKIIPEEYGQEINVNCEELTQTVERVSLLINDSFTTPVRCAFEENQVTLSCATSAGRATEVFKINMSGEPFTIGLNSRYLLDALKAADKGTVNIKFNGPNAGVLITGGNKEKDDFLYLIMPMRMK